MSPLFAYQAAGEALQSLPYQGQLPLDAQLGSLADPVEHMHPALDVVYRAFNGFYGPVWFEQYVHMDAIYALNRMFGHVLAQSLPARVTLGIPVIKGSQVAIPVILENVAGTQRNLEVILTADAQGAWKISSLMTR